MVKETLLRQIPAVDEIAKWWEETGERPEVPRQSLINIIRELTQKLREEISAGILTAGEKLAKEQLLSLLKNNLIKIEERKLGAVINATGVILHTNLGRAILSESSVKAVAEVAANYSNLELDMVTGERGSRYSHLEEYLCKLTGAEGALVVNNNASAVLLTLAALGQGKEAIVSRGELVEIGGSFRVPEVMEQSGVKLIEVGATNKTYCYDYEKAITDQTALLLKVHTSNYRIVGFTKETTRKELVQLGEKYNIPVVEDLGSGFLVDLSKWGISGEPTVQECIASGVDVVTFSGDKLLGGPQAGIIVGSKGIIDRLKKYPLTRAVRIDKFTVAGLEATLKEYLNNAATKNIPTLHMLTITAAELSRRVEKIAGQLKELLAEEAEVSMAPGYSKVGGGALPTTELPTTLLVIKTKKISCQEASFLLRQGKVKIMARVQEEQLLFDLRTVLPEQEEQLVNKLDQVLRGETECII